MSTIQTQTQSFSRKDPRAWVRLYLEGLEKEGRIVPGAAQAILPRLAYDRAIDQIRNGFAEGGEYSRFLMPGAKPVEGHPIQTVARRLGLSEGSVKAMFEANAVAWAGLDEPAILQKLSAALQSEEHAHRSPIAPDPLNGREQRVANVLERLKSAGQIAHNTSVDHFARKWGKEIGHGEMFHLVNVISGRLQHQTDLWATDQPPKLEHGDIEALMNEDRASTAEATAAMSQEGRYAAF